MDIILAPHLVTREQAFDIHRVVSQHRHRKLAEIAADVVEMGAVPGFPDTRTPGPAHSSGSVVLIQTEQSGE